MPKKLFLTILGFVFWICFIGGTIYSILSLRKEKAVREVFVEKPVMVRKEIDFSDEELFKEAVESVSKKYNINKRVFYAIRECEGGSAFTKSPTDDIGYFQINWKTAKSMGVEDLRPLIDPRQAAEIAAQLLSKYGLDVWKGTKTCIENKLIFIEE